MVVRFHSMNSSVVAKGRYRLVPTTRVHERSALFDPLPRRGKEVKGQAATRD